MWFRVFGLNETAPEPVELLAHLHGLGLKVKGDFGGDDHGWFRATLTLPEDGQPLQLQRYLTDTDDIRDDLNSWAAWVESVPEGPYTNRLMQHLIGTQQMFTLDCPRDLVEEDSVQKLCLELCQFLARHTKGVYQIDNEGFFSPGGELLLTE